MDLRQLRQFIAVYETGSFRRAAEVCHVSQPAISNGIAQLEVLLGVTLFDRGGGLGPSPTLFATHLYGRAKLIAAELSQARDEIAALRQGKAGAISIGVGPLFEHTVVPSVIAAFTKRFPDVRISTVEGISSELFRRLLRGEVDFFLGTLASRSARHDGLEIQTLRQANDVTISASDHEIWTHGDVSLAKLAEYPWVVSASVTEATESFFDRFSSADISPPKTVVRTDSLPILRELVGEHGFLCVVSREFALLRDKRGPLFRELEENHFPFQRRICIVKRAGSPLTKAAETFKKLFISHLKNSEETFRSHDRSAIRMGSSSQPGALQAPVKRGRGRPRGSTVR